MIDWTLNYFLGLLQCFTNYYIIYIFLDGFFQRRHKHMYVNLLVISSSALLLCYINSFKNPMYNTVSTLVIMIFMLTLLFKDRFTKLIFAGILLVAISVGCEFLATAGFSIICASTVSETALQVIQTSSFSFISTSIFFVLTTISKFLLNKYGKLKTSEENCFNLALLPLPILSIFIAYFIVKASALAKFNKVMNFQSMLIIMSLVIVNIVVFASDSDARKKHQYKTQIAEMYAQGEMKEALILQQDLNFKEINNLVHDFKHQLLTLQMSLNEVQSFEDRQIVSDNISSAISNLPQHELYSSVESSALRCILIHTHNECQRLGITFSTKIGFSNFDFISYQDICTIFSNAFENAIFACEEMRRKQLEASISLKIQPINEMISVHIQNDKINEIHADNENIFTSKPDKIHHGIGISNIKRAVQKYGGTVQTDYTDSSFKIAFLFTLSRS